MTYGDGSPATGSDQPGSESPGPLTPPVDPYRTGAMPVDPTRPVDPTVPTVPVAPTAPGAPTVPVPQPPPPATGYPAYGTPTYPAPPGYRAPPASAPPGYSAPPAYGTPAYSAPPAYGTPAYSAPPAYGTPTYSAPPAYGTPTYSAPPAYGYGPPGYPYPPPPPPSRSKAPLIVAIVVVVVLLLGGGTVTAVLLGRTSNQAGGPTGPTATVTHPPSPTATPFTGDLRTLLLTPPGSSHPFQKPGGTNGNLSAQQVASEYNDPTYATKMLRDNNFTSGAIVQWHDADDVLVTIELYQFETPAGANSFQYFEQDGYTNDDTFDNASPVDDVDNSGFFIAKKADDNNYFGSVVMATRGNVTMWLEVRQPDRVNRGTTIDIAQRQFQRLPLV